MTSLALKPAVVLQKATWSSGLTNLEYRLQRGFVNMLRQISDTKTQGIDEEEWRLDLCRLLS